MISKVSAPNSVPTDISDYVAQNAHMMAFMNQVNMQAFVLTNPTTSDKPKIGLGSYISHGGSLYKVETAAEDIAGSPADGKVYVRVTGDATLSASFVTDISSYNYNHAYGTLTSGSYTLLPYEIRKSGSSWLKYRYDASKGTTDQDLRTTDAPTFATINTGQGNFKIGQNLRTTDAVAFATVNTGHGANELYPMNQGVRTTDAVDFATVNTGQGANKVHKITGLNYHNPVITLGAMSSGDIVFITATADRTNSSISLPSGAGSYFVFCSIGNKTTENDYETKQGYLSGGTRIYYGVPEGSNMTTLFIIRKA